MGDVGGRDRGSGRDGVGGVALPPSRQDRPRVVLAGPPCQTFRTGGTPTGRRRAPVTVRVGVRSSSGRGTGLFRWAVGGPAGYVLPVRHEQPREIAVESPVVRAATKIGPQMVREHPHGAGQGRTQPNTRERPPSQRLCWSAACRRSYGRRASGDATSSADSAAARAFPHRRPYRLPESGPPRAPRNSRPSGVVPCPSR